MDTPDSPPMTTNVGRDRRSDCRDGFCSKGIESSSGGAVVGVFLLTMALVRLDVMTPPEFVRDEGEEQEPTLSDARYAFERYQFDIDGDAEKNRGIYGSYTTKRRTMEAGRIFPPGQTTLTGCPTKTEIANLLDVRTPTRTWTLKSVSTGRSTAKGRILTRQRDRFAVSAPVADMIGEFMRDHS